MTNKNILATFSLIIFCSFQIFSQSTLYKTSISVAELQKDFEVLKSVLTNYHPGLYRFQDSASIENHFTVLQNELNQDLSTTEFYLILSKFTAKLKCGHTFCSYYNQKKTIQDSIFNKRNKVPFTFYLFEKRMLIDKNLSNNKINEGSEVVSINNVPVSSIIESLLPYIKGDGSNDGKRLSDLELSGLGKFEAFDIYFPLLFPPINSSYELEIKGIENNVSQRVKVKCVSRADRFDMIEQKYGKQPATYDDLWKFKILSEQTAYLQLGTFVTNKLTIDWKKFLARAFDEVKSKNIPNLIIDKLKKFKSYKSKKIGLLGLTFKGETDDTRDSLSIVLLNKLKKLNLKILQSDEYYKTKNGISKKELINKSDIIIIGAPHKAYKKLKINKKKKKLIDIWDII